ncbi:flavin-dependent reductase [Acrocarpospora corrugata]|uniref:Flavin-dependent reductase n=1 Tax=Acrocarpospora corrugata TaxID=35763 RepID=A0A5M3W5M4_9ACTN|nr:flavin reductase family protein [Acrocarpospora corrugata]GES04357.1 flavin-dependent reductase [Acrocarpospora corrugata]
MTAAADEQPPSPLAGPRLRLVPPQVDRAPGGRTQDASAYPPVAADEFRQALGAHAAGVVVVTAFPDGQPVGLTATSFTSVSLTPPLVSFYVDRASTTWPDLSRADYFAVNVLSGDQADLATRFARKGIDRFAAPTRWTPGPADVPLLADVSGHLVCQAHTTADVGDHILVVGLVITPSARPDADPLLYHQGRFGNFHPR